MPLSWRGSTICVRKNLYRAFSNQRELDYNENYCSSDDTTVGNELQTKHWYHKWEISNWCYVIHKQWKNIWLSLLSN